MKNPATSTSASNTNTNNTIPLALKSFNPFYIEPTQQYSVIANNDNDDEYYDDDDDDNNNEYYDDDDDTDENDNYEYNPTNNNRYAPNLQQQQQQQQQNEQREKRSLLLQTHPPPNQQQQHQHQNSNPRNGYHQPPNNRNSNGSSSKSVSSFSIGYSPLSSPHGTRRNRVGRQRGNDTASSSASSSNAPHIIFGCCGGILFIFIFVIVLLLSSSPSNNSTNKHHHPKNPNKNSNTTNLPSNSYNNYPTNISNTDSASTPNQQDGTNDNSLIVSMDHKSNKSSAIQPQQQQPSASPSSTAVIKNPTIDDSTSVLFTNEQDNTTEDEEDITSGNNTQISESPKTTTGTTTTSTNVTTNADNDIDDRSQNSHDTNAATGNDETIPINNPNDETDATTSTIDNPNANNEGGDDKEQKEEGEEDDDDEGWDVPVTGKLATSNSSSTNDNKNDDGYENDTTNDDWTIQQRIPEIIIVGERHSGVEILAEQLDLCYNTKNNNPSTTTVESETNDTNNNTNTNNNTIVEIRTSLFGRETIWFQDIDLLLQERSVRNNKTKRKEENYYQLYHTIIIVAVRDPYHWINIMRLKPIHMPSHYANVSDHTILPIKQFLQRPWTLRDDNLVPNGTTTMLSSSDNRRSCQLGFNVDEVIPCHVDHRYYGSDIDTPIYEVNRMDGTVFPTIVQLRSAKLHHYLHDLPDAFGSIMDTTGTSTYENMNNMTAPIIVPYETGLTESILEQINIRLESFNLQHNPTTCSTTILVDDDNSSLQRLGPKFFQFVNKNLNWTIEAEIGYYPK